jgi:hypothetical protein
MPVITTILSLSWVWPMEGIIPSKPPVALLTWLKKRLFVRLVESAGTASAKLDASRETVYCETKYEEKQGLEAAADAMRKLDVERMPQ